MRPLRLPAAARNPISVAGIAVATAMGAVFLTLVLLEALGFVSNPYLGLVVFVAVPVVFVVALLLIPLGVWIETRRRRRSSGPLPAGWPVIDLGKPHQRRVALAVMLLTVANIVIISMAAYGGLHYMETAPFCGEVCHTTMEPQYAAHQLGPHARVRCVDCHVGPGAAALLQSKLAGTRQLYHVATDNVPAPIPSPVQTMRPARDTCENCHWPEKVHGDRLREIREYADDEANTENVTRLLMHVGGGSATLGVGSGIHWHMNLENRVEYVTTDARRESIPYVRLTDRSGTVREYLVEGTTIESIASGERRTMDCIDCHNRPAHTFSATPERAVDQAIAFGRIPRELPFVRREAVAAMKVEYPGRDAALAAIARRFREFYGTRPVDARLVNRAVAATQDVWARNVFPAMRVTWGTYASHIGHLDSPGCFRCHDDNHKAQDGSVIRQDCELCHAMPSQ